MKFLLDSASSRHLICVFLALALSSCSAARTQQAERAPTPTLSAQASPQPTSDGNINRPTSEPYKGDLSIFEEPERDRKLQIERVMDVLGIREGSAVADIGAGSGWFTVRAARRAGEKGAVYAVEINPDYLKHIEERAGQEKLLNIKTVLGTEDNPRLPEKSVDAVLLLKTYHEIAEPVRLLVNLRRSLRENARVGVIDRNGKGEDHGVKREVVIEEVKRAGYALAEEHDFVKPDGMDYFLVFKAQARK
jgi:SAM-dependent methyltransferase